MMIHLHHTAITDPAVMRSFRLEILTFLSVLRWVVLCLKLLIRELLFGVTRICKDN
jgi:hypothetical protein